MDLRCLVIVSTFCLFNEVPIFLKEIRSRVCHDALLPQ